MSDGFSHYAVSQKTSRGRVFKEKPHPYRSDFDRDRDRIIHCEAFRRLEGKTQVFTTGLNDSYRNRLTHSIEVAQIGRTISRNLGLNEALTEAICLAHDLGHSPFGHTGEQILNDLMAEFGGFEHNQQALRIVDLLEHPYPDFTGLNLMYETRLGLARHKSPYDEPAETAFSELNCSLEGQVAAIADRIAVNSHDLEDGMRSGLINSEQLQNIQIFVEAETTINARAIKDQAVSRTRAAKAIIEMLVSDCIQASRENLLSADVKTLNDIYAHSENLIIFSPESCARLIELEEFLLQNFYRHESLVQTAEKAKNWLGELFRKLCRQPQLMPNYFQKLADQQGLYRTVADYIAGMTDRFCLEMLKAVQA